MNGYATNLFIFCRLKINNDIHEFILEIGTVENNKVWLIRIPVGLSDVKLSQTILL